MKKPYVVSADIYLLLSKWTKENDFVLPSKKFFKELREKFSLKMRTIFPVFEFVSEKEICSELHRLVTKSNLPSISLDHVYFQENLQLETTRLVDINLETIKEPGHRTGTPAINLQLQKLKTLGIKDVVLVDDVIYSGNGMLWAIDKLKECNINVKSICVGIGVGMGVKLLTEFNYPVHCVRLFEEVIDELCERDFYFIPGSGHLRRIGQEDFRVPYFKPFGKPNKWASIPDEEELDFSIFCIQQNISLFEEIEKCSGKKILCKDLGFNILGLPKNGTRFVDVIRNIQAKLIEQKLIVEKLEKILKATYIGEYSVGHQEATISRFKTISDNQCLVVKSACSKSINSDIKDNILGYKKISEAGGSEIVPTKLKEFGVNSNIALVMVDLGLCFKHTSKDISDYQVMGNSFLKIVKKTVVGDKEKNYIRPSMLEVKKYISNYLAQMTTLGSNLTENINSWNPDLDFDFASLMLLDFTPDNVFIRNGQIYFIDPWKQVSYLGHPAVSLGQFSTLAHDVYNLPFSKEGKVFLHELAIKEVSKILKCSESVSENAFCMGAILQYTLSAYVRRESDKTRANELLLKANEIITR